MRSRGHHRGHGRIIARSPWHGSSSFYDPGPSTIVEVGDDRRAARAIAYILSLPMGQRVAAYVKIFGHAPPPGLLEGTIAMHGIIGSGGRDRSRSLSGLLETAMDNKGMLAAGAVLAYLLFFKKKGR